MSAGLNAVPNLNVASIRDTPGVSSDSSKSIRSAGKRDTFSQMLRRTSEDQKSSGAARSRDSEKKDRKPATKDDDANTNTGVAIDANNKTVADKPLPISFLLGLPSGQFENFDNEASSAASPSQIAGNQLPSAKLKELAGGDPMPLMAQAQDLTSTVSIATANSDKSDASAASAQGTELLGIGESGNSPKGAAGMLSANALAFAMRLGSGGEALSASKPASSADSVSPAVSDSIQTNLALATSTAIQASSGSTFEENAHEHQESAQGQNIVDLSAAHTPEPFDTTKITEEQAAPAAQVPAEPPTLSTTEPVRNLHMQLVSDDNRRVDVRLIDRGGELHVSVKSADTALAQNLQDHLPDLTARLEKQHMETEVWVPKAAEPSKADSGNANGSLSDPNAKFHSGNSEGRREGRQQAKPDWVDALENYS